MQEQTALSSTSTVQAPQSPASQPTLVPMSPRFSRRTLDNRRPGEVKTFTARPFTLKARSTSRLRVSMAGEGLMAEPPRKHPERGEPASESRHVGRPRWRVHRQSAKGKRGGRRARGKKVHDP